MPENEQQPNGADQTQAPPAAETAPTWETWLESAPDDVKDLYEGHVNGLKSALSTERDQRKDLAKQLADAAKKAADGSEAKTQLEQISKQLELTQRRADFFETLPDDVVSGKLAWIAAESSDSFKRDGSPDWAALREDFPELFNKQTTPPAHAGAGTNKPGQGATMNDYIRKATGRQ